MRTRTSAVLLGAAITALAACGGSSGSASTPTTPADVDLVMTATNTLEWKEHDVTAKAGDVTIELKNDSGVAHNLYVVAADGTQNPNSISSTGLNDNPVETLQLAAGSYTIVCKIVGHNNMHTTLTVS
jgi:plastocyanin